MRQDPAPGGIGQGGERPIQCARIFNHLVKYYRVIFNVQIFFVNFDLWNLADRASRSNDGPCAKRQQRPEEQRFNRKLQVILAREEISGELQNKSSPFCRSSFFCFPNSSLNCDYAHR
jgi:hypothetical protein